MTYLDQIDSPDDLKRIPREKLGFVAQELRHRIIDVVSKNGGHLASSLGAVELTIALHYVFDIPKDTLIWDVGHQSYAHKLLTGRQRNFDTLRKYKGISGFTKVSESPYDAFTVGHASTSISAGLGMCFAKALHKDDSNVISVIGDGSLTAGLAYEGLNQAGDLKQKFIVVFNDNEMSISANVGALSSYLSRTFSRKTLQSMRNQFGQFLKSVPKIGDDMYGWAKRWEESFKTFVTPGMLFEAFNFDYFGPIDGHNLDHLIDILSNIKDPDSPILLHVTTKKGKGYGPAEKNPVYFHGVGAFSVDTGKTSATASTAPPSYTKVFGDYMIALAKENTDIVAVTAAMPEGTGLSGFAEQFPDRFVDVGIAEQHAVTFAAGLAAKGIRPVVAIYSTFLQRGYDQVLHDVCIDHLPVIFALDRGGIVGEDGPTHHGLFDYAYLRAMPNMTIMAPMDENELVRMMKTAVAHTGPISLRYPRGNGQGVSVDFDAPAVDIGKAKTIRQGEDLLIIGIGRSVNDAVEAADALSVKGIHATVVNARFVKPLDKNLIVSLAGRIKKVITVEEHVLPGGFGSAVLELISDANMEQDLDGIRTIRVGIRDEFVEHGSQKELRRDYGIDSKAIVDAALKLCREKQQD